MFRFLLRNRLFNQKQWRKFRENLPLSHCKSKNVKSHNLLKINDVICRNEGNSVKSYLSRILDTKNSGVAVWITKLPAVITDKIRHLKKETPVGLITIDSKPNSEELSFELSSELLTIGLPASYEISLHEISSFMYVLRTDPHPKIEGSIVKDCNIRPVINQEYLAYKKKMLDAQKHQQPICETITLREANTTDKIVGVADIDFLSKKRKKMLSDKKRGRLEPDEVRNMIFNAFEGIDAWTAKDLAKKINQPINYTQEIMNEICILNKKDHRNTWELKPDYKNRSNNV